MSTVMLVYRDGGRHVDCRRELTRLQDAAAQAATSADAALGFLIETGEFESGLADALMPDRDAVHPLSERLRRVTIAAARAWLDAVDGQCRELLSASIDEELGRLQGAALPDQIEVRVSEGFAYYALYPSAYAASARRFADQTSARRAHVIGIRSIGTSLSAVVVAALERCGCAASSSTVRPRGHPFDRQLRLRSDLEAVFRHEAERGASFIVVDEGPGISGSSFAAVASALRSLGIPATRIPLFCSWDPGPAALRSEAAQRIWREHPRYSADASAPATPERVFGIAAPAVDFSGGRWRAALAGDCAHWPAVHAQHERWKVFVPSERRLIRFAGLGPYGAATARRAEALATLGIGQPPGALRAGFLELPFVEGSPVRRCESTPDADAVGAYIGRVAAAFPTGTAVDADSLNAMIDTNLRDVAPGPRLDTAVEIPAVALDGRMLAHEWIRTGQGLVKVDALDHHADHFFPGPQSPAWDLAGAQLELGMDETHTRAMLQAYERVSSDRDARTHLPFYRVAYAAFRLGYTTLAAETLRGTEDGARFGRAARFYSQCALNATACFRASPKSPLKQIARSSMNT